MTTESPIPFTIERKLKGTFDLCYFGEAKFAPTFPGSGHPRTVLV